MEKKIEPQATIKIGITGHRDLAHPSAVKIAISKTLNEILVESDALKIIILSSLAEGADRLAAESALELTQATLYAVLPFTADDYSKDFGTKESKKDFHFFLQQASKVNELDGRTSRTAAYEAVGQHVVNNCDMMIAVWNGRQSRGRGGTAEIVAYALQMRRPVYWINSSRPGQCILLDGTISQGGNNEETE